MLVQRLFRFCVETQAPQAGQGQRKRPKKDKNACKHNSNTINNNNIHANDNNDNDDNNNDDITNNIANDKHPQQLFAPAPQAGQGQRKRPSAQGPARTPSNKKKRRADSKADPILLPFVVVSFSGYVSVVLLFCCDVLRQQQHINDNINN